MSETPVAPASIRDVLLGVGESFSKRGRLGLLAAVSLMLGLLAVIFYFTVFPIPRPAGLARHAQPGPPLDQSAVAVASTFTKLGWNEHNCRAASRYSSGANCPAGVLPAGKYAFALNSWLINRHCGTARARPTPSHEHRRLSPGCIQYSATNGETISYTMAKMPKGWRIVAIKAGHGG
jgi:hypothetical protein